MKMIRGDRLMAGAVLLALAVAGVGPVDGTAGGEIPKPEDAPPPLAPEQSAKRIKVPQGFRVELVASEPLIHEPSGVCWDERGRLFVCELHGYNLEGQYDVEELNKTGKLDRVVRRIQADERAKQAAAAETYGTVKLLLDTDGDGRMDQAEVWADRLPPCYGVCPAREGVVVACAPDIVYLADRDGDGRAEVREVLFTGFATGPLERGINAPQWGMDDWIYFGGGHGGGTVSGPRLEQPLTLPGTDFRIKADGSAIEPVGGRTHTFGFTFTELGDRFVITTRAPLFVAPLPWRYLARNPDAAAPELEQAALSDQRVYPISRPHPWRTRRAEDPGFSKFYTDRYGIEESAPNGYFTSACSPLVYQDLAMGGMSELRGQLLVCEPAQNLVHRAIVERDGPRLTVRRAEGEEQSEFLASSDPWFHPMNLSHGPDGAVWIVDFYREIIEDYSAIPRYLQQQYGLVNGQDRGRIYRLVHERMPQPPPADMMRLTGDQLAREVASPYLWRRQTARRLLVERNDKPAAQALADVADKANEPAALLNVLYTLESLGELESGLLASALTHREPAVRVQALRLADRRFSDRGPLLEAALRLAGDEDAAVKLQLALSLGESSDPRVIGVLARLARQHGDVAWLHDAVLTSLSGRAGDMLRELLGDPHNAADPPERDGGPPSLGQARGLLEPLCAAIAARRHPGELSEAIVRIAAARDTAVQAACLQGLRSRFPNTVTVALTSAARDALAELAASSHEKVQSTAQALVAVLKVETQAQREARLAEAARDLADVQLGVEERLAGVAQLKAENDPAVTATLLGAFADGTPQVREAILEAVFARSDRMPAMIAALEEQAVPASALSAGQRLALLEQSDGGLRERAAKLFTSSNAATAEDLARFVDALRSERDLGRGERVFREKCANCHRAQGIGFAVGPDLTAEFQRAEETIVMDVVAPSEAIASGYVTYVIETTDGLVLTGLVAGESATSILLRQPEGKEESVLRKDIALMKASPLSMMPEDLIKTLTPQELADAIGWLRHPPAAGDGSEAGGTDRAIER